MKTLGLLEKIKSEKFLSSGDKYYKDILESILIPIACICMLIAITLLLGRLFYKIQPWFSIFLKVKQNSIVKARLFSIVKKQKNIRIYLLPS
ncbi:hypothetical protein CVT91_17165 [Candidatus Atribacteria bacterium HGW-Atribacteria-1]|nr:MAG: hypothetical protein CVT91_17165 [Candidatus Atribacteria bacterium HGW-Atribacteria-1]